ncbi:glycosyltransferase family 39 protein [Campylobacter sp. RM16188]|uniref:ArnT family glycosyltransferase n=1 Tax=Campylobacter sp. RM16188 TaxID=1705725 RepID=UPI001552FB02|nr:glycosyltransferase family 39 protein [Campylobacter sp. RM16188]
MQKQSVLSSETFLIFFICFIDVLFLTYGISTLSISYYEAEIFYNTDQISALLAKISTGIFGQNDYALRLPFVICHLISVALLYKISKSILKRKFDRVISVAMFILLPGVLASAILVNDAGIVIMLTLLVLYCYQNRQILAFYLLLIVLAFISGSFLVFFLSLFIFGIFRRDARLAWICAILFGFCFYLHGFETGGKPRGYFLDTVSVFAAVFSPFVFFYFVYAIYRIWIKEQKSLLWFVVVTSFCLCIVLSSRQRLELENFLPFCVISTPLIVRVFFSSYRVRLPVFRRFYKILATFTAISLVASFYFALFNEIFYKFLENPKKHFAYKYHMAKELAEELKKIGVDKIYTDDEKLALRLKFYGIENGKDKLINLDIKEKYANITIEKFNKPIAKFNYIKER